MYEIIILSAVFFCVLIPTFLTMGYFAKRREIAENLRTASAEPTKFQPAEFEIASSGISENNIDLKHYFEVVSSETTRELDIRLIRAGFFAENTVTIYNSLRTGITFIVFATSCFLILWNYPALDIYLASSVSILASVGVYLLIDSVLDRLGRRKQIEFRKLFPDFIDLLIVCIDAGMSIEAAIDRVTREFLRSNRDFGIHLSIMMLEIRAGRSLKEALTKFATRINVDEARSMAILFRQSEELGSDIMRSLRVFSAEMRQSRMIRAEEQANALPVKMIFPLALFLFPTNLIIVLVPILISIAAMFGNLAAN